MSDKFVVQAFATRLPNWQLCVGSLMSLGDAMSARINTISFRVAISLAGLWIVAITAHGLTSGDAERILLARGSAAECADLAKFTVPGVSHQTPEDCQLTIRGTETEQQLLMRGNPLLLFAQYALLPAAILLALTAYWADIRSLLAKFRRKAHSVGTGYVRWIKEGNQGSTPLG